MGKMMIPIYLVFVFSSRIRYVKANGGESSGEYLQKAMFQLQEYNVPSSANFHDRLSSGNDYKSPVYTNKYQQNYGVQRITMNTRQNPQKYQNQSFHHNILPSKKVDLHSSDFEAYPHYYQSHGPAVNKIREPEVLGFTRPELAAMYKSALEKGTTMSLSSLTSALSSGEVPQVTQTHVEFPIKQPLYQYYFFPLKTFMSEFKKDHGYKTIPTPAIDNTGAAQTTQTQLSNPLFVAISTFVTMAIVFMMSIFFLPKLTQLDILHSRSIQDDLFYVSNAIERYNVTKKFKDNVR